jgi:hypothetical protein
LTSRRHCFTAIAFAASVALLVRPVAPARAEPAAPAPAEAESSGPAHAEAEPAAPAWIFFTDRGELEKPGLAREAALAETSRRITPRALARRAKAALESGDPAAPLDDRDLPPDPAYVAGVAARGATIRTHSAWLNAVSVEASAASLERIRALPFVAEIRPVAGESRNDAGATGPAQSTGSAQSSGAAQSPGAPHSPGAAQSPGAPRSPGAPHSPDAVQSPGAARYAHANFNAGPSYLQIDMLHVPEVHAMGLHGEGVLVCVLDSGFELDHEALRHLEVRGQRDFVNGDGDPSYDPRTDARTQSIHGTAVLSTIAGYVPGKLIGPAYRAEYLLGMTERVGSERPVEEDFWCAGVEWAEAEGADLVTSSLSYHAWYRWRDLDGRTAVATRAANLALSRGLLIVNAIGNEGPGEGSIGAPADAPGMITVGAVNGIGNVAGFSSVGPTYDRRVKPDVVAPGVAVFTARARTYDEYARLNGTSFSAPLVAGCAALVLSRHPDWGPEMVHDAIAMSASRADRPDNRYGWGIVNARDAVFYPFIEGLVTDAATREPLKGATVRWEPGGGVDSLDAAASDSPPRGSVETDSTGAYVIPNLPRGAYTITVSRPGYFDATAGPYAVPPNLGDASVALRYRGE